MMTFQKESLTACLPEALPLAREHYNAVRIYDDIDLDPDFNQYAKMEELKQFRFFTARSSGDLAGYAAFLVYRNLNYRSNLHATMALLYLRPAHRKGLTGYKMLLWVERQLRAEGVQTLGYGVTIHHNYSPLLKRMGYSLAEVVYMKRLDV